MLKREHLSHPHLMLPDVGNHYAIALGDLGQLGDDVVRRDAVATMNVLVERFLLLPLKDLLMPFRPVGVALRDTLAALDRGLHVCQYRLDIADDRNIDLDVLRNRRRVDIDVNNRLGLRREFRNLAGDAIVEARADRDQAIGVAYGGVGAVRTVHPEHPEPERVGGGVRSQSHQRLGNWNAKSLNQLAQLGRRAGPLHAAADVEQRLRTFLDRLDGALDLAGITANCRLVAAQFNFLGQVKNMLGLLHVLGQIDDDRTGASAAGDIKRFLDDARDILDVLDQEIVLGARAGDADEVGLLESIIADHRGRDLARQNYHRGGIHVRVGDSGDGIGGAGPRSDDD